MEEGNYKTPSSKPAVELDLRPAVVPRPLVVVLVDALRAVGRGLVVGDAADGPVGQQLERERC